MHVVVDMTPLEPGGRNGGAGLVATSLVEHMAALAPASRWTLLTRASSHAELAHLEGPNVQRACLLEPSPASGQLVKDVGRRALAALVPPRVAVHVRERVRKARSRLSVLPRVAALDADLLFCPFTVPYFWQPDTPMVSVVYDLQELSYPEHFTPEQRLFRARHLREACARAARLTCISEYVRQTLLANVDVPPERVLSIPLGLMSPLQATDPDGGILERLDLRAGDFLLYPANVWPHKNHHRLFEALRLFRARRPRSRLRLVCTAAPNHALANLFAAADPTLVTFAGYVSAAELQALMRDCAAVIIPSLYEGFGMPALEAMALGKPVLCSNVTALPEVVGDAGGYFDPHDVESIGAAIARLEDEPERMAEVAARGPARAKRFGTARDVAARYLDVFDAVLAERRG